jgi:hypothetical protein
MLNSFRLTGQGKLRQQYFARRKSFFFFKDRVATTAILRDFSRTRKAAVATNHGSSRTTEILAFVRLLAGKDKDNRITK